MMTDNVIKKIDSFILEIEQCQMNNEFEELKIRIKTFFCRFFDSNHPYCTSDLLEKELEKADYYGLYGSVEHDRKLTKDIKPLISHLKKVREVIIKDELPINNKTGMTIQVHDSPGANIVGGNASDANQISNVYISDFNNLYEKAVAEINTTDKLSSDEISDLLDMLSYVKESIEQGKKPKQSFLKPYANFGDKCISVGANLVTLWAYIEPYLNTIPK